MTKTKWHSSQKSKFAVKMNTDSYYRTGMVQQSWTPI